MGNGGDSGDLLPVGCGALTTAAAVPAGGGVGAGFRGGACMGGAAAVVAGGIGCAGNCGSMGTDGAAQEVQPEFPAAGGGGGVD